MNRKKESIFVKIICIMAFCGVAFMGFCEAVSEDLTDNLVRIHVIANSNTEEDQKIKLMVRDYIIKEGTAMEKENKLTISAVAQKKDALTEGVNRLLKAHGKSYAATMETGQFFFPMKQYENITLPRGTYDAVRIVLGEGKGTNWWCVMYPPLCFTESSKGEAEKQWNDAVSPVTGAVIDNENIKLQPAFKAVELWQAFKKKVENKLG